MPSASLPTARDRHDRVPGPVDDQRRGADRGEDGADVDLGDGVDEGQDVPGRGGVPLRAAEADHPRLVGIGLAVEERQDRAVPPLRGDQVAEAGEDLWGDALRVIVSPGEAGEGADQGEGGHALGIGRCEQERQRPALGEADDGGALGPDRIEHGPHIVHALLERRDGHPIRQPRPALVEADEPAEGRIAPEHPAPVRVVPLLLEM